MLGLVDYTALRPAVMLCRVSGRGQMDGNGLDRQLEIGQQAAAVNGHYLEWVYRFDISGRKSYDERTDIQEVVNDLVRDGRTDRPVYVEDTTRLARRFVHQEIIILELEAKHQIHIIIAKTGEDITQAMMDNPTKKMAAQVMGIVSEWERSQIVYRLREGRRAQAEKNYANGGRRKCEGQKGYVDRDKKIITDIQAMYAAGMRKKAIAVQLNQEGRYTASGRPWTDRNVDNILRRYKPRKKPYNTQPRDAQ